MYCYVGIGNPSVDVREQALKQYIKKPAISIKRMRHLLCFFKRVILFTMFSFLLIYVLLVFGVWVFSILGFGGGGGLRPSWVCGDGALNMNLNLNFAWHQRIGK